MMTAAALRWFADSGCDIVVLEVGLGGRYDATNVIPCPECCVIANIGLDHTAILGGTLSKIAYEKAGIIKYGSAVVMYQQFGETMEVVRDVCREMSAELYVPDFDDISVEFDSIDGQVFFLSRCKLRHSASRRASAAKCRNGARSDIRSAQAGVGYRR